MLFRDTVHIHMGYAMTDKNLMIAGMLQNGNFHTSIFHTSTTTHIKLAEIQDGRLFIFAFTNLLFHFLRTKEQDSNY